MAAKIATAKQIKAITRDLKRHHFEIGKKRDELRRSRETIEELETDTEEAMDNIEAAIEQLSKLQ